MMMMMISVLHKTSREILEKEALIQGVNYTMRVTILSYLVITARALKP